MVPIVFFRIFSINKGYMTLEEFKSKHKERYTNVSTNDVLMRVASNLSDLHIEKDIFTGDQIDNKLNSLKGYIFDYMDVLRTTNVSDLPINR